LKDPLFRESKQLCANSSVPAFRKNAHGLNIAHESAFHVQNHESGYLTLEHSQIDFARGIGQHFERILVTAAQGDPGFAAGHDLRTSLRLRGILEFPYFNDMAVRTFHGLG
jgi:hypothetical protein